MPSTPPIARTEGAATQIQVAVTRRGDVGVRACWGLGGQGVIAKVLDICPETIGLDPLMDLMDLIH